MKTLAILLSIVAVSVLTFYAVAGVACLYMTAPMVQNERECDMIQRINGQLWCMNTMISEDE